MLNRCLARCQACNIHTELKEGQESSVNLALAMWHWWTGGVREEGKAECSYEGWETWVRRWSDRELQVKGMPGSVTVAILGQRVLTLTSEEQTLPTGTVTPPPLLLHSSCSGPCSHTLPYPWFILFLIYSFISKSVNSLLLFIPLSVLKGSFFLFLGSSLMFRHGRSP